jgi:DNA repair protein RadA/Sms
MTGGAVTGPAPRIHEIDPAAYQHTTTGIGEFDRVLGGGLVAGQVILIAGEPGVGKSTLLLSVSDHAARAGRKVLYVSGEESAGQIKVRANRIGVNEGDLFIAEESDLTAILAQVETIDPDLVIVDSIQTVASPNIDGRVGGVAQVSEVATVLTRMAKTRHCPLILVGQVLKDTSQIAGPMSLAHLVDCVLHFEGDRSTSLRLLRTGKNRYGPADEIACFAHEGAGLVEVPDPSGLFLAQRDEPVPGTCVTVTLEGRRPLLAEVQALVAPTNAPNPRRGVSGLDAPRANMLLAVTERHARIRMFDKDSYLATIGGMRITEPAADLALCVALASAAWDLPVPVDLCAIGEVALSGDVRAVPHAHQRLTEAARLGFRRVLAPHGTVAPTGVQITVIPVDSLAKAFAALRAAAPEPADAGKP